MTIFITLAVLLTASTLLLLARGLLRHATVDTAQPIRDDAALLRQQMAQLKQLNASGALGHAQFAEAKTALERRIVDAVLNDPAAAAAPVQRPSMTLIAGLAGFVVAVVAAGYAWVGTPAALDPAVRAAQAPAGGEGGVGHAVTSEQIAAMAEKLAARLKDNPDDAQGWGMLARSYAVMGRFADSLPAFKRALELQKDDPILLADYADAMAVANNRSLEGEPMKLVEQALKVDPNNLKALSLAGTAAFDRKDFAGAIRYWEKLVQAAPKDSPFVAQVQASIDEARQLMGGKAAPAAQRPGPDQKATAPSAGVVSGTVTLAAALAGKAAPGDTVFVFARAAEGSRIPLALVRKQVKDLPIQFTLDDSMAMSPATNLSSVKQVIVGARISKSGNAVPQAGDLQGLSAAVPVGTSGLKIEIAQTVGN
jgi:cytochrome c-type biogenesis protein CcmH